jgi:pimeloyl-ACP methyl ester carboxylesterase
MTPSTDKQGATEQTPEAGSSGEPTGISTATGLNRRRFCGAAVATLASVPLGALSSFGKVRPMPEAMTEATEQGSDKTEIRPFRVKVPEAALADLRRRIIATRWPERETVEDESQGVPLALIQGLMRYWATDYNWRNCEAKLNSLPQFMTEIDGLDIHFIHVRSKHENALPLMVTHGWPGSVIEQMKIIDPLTNPTGHGASASDAFHLVIPSMPGYGFSAKPVGTGWDLGRIARAWVVLMKRLGYTRFAAQGGDWGAGYQRRWLCRRHPNCSAFMSTSLAPFHQTSQRRSRPTTRRPQLCQPKNLAPTSSSRPYLGSAELMHRLWVRAPKPFMDWRIHPLPLQPGSLTTLTVMHSQRPL